MKRRSVVRPDSPKLTQKRTLGRPAANEHSDKTSRAGAERRRMHGCPSCGLNRRLGELDIILGAAFGHFDENGVWKFEGETGVFWDEQRQQHEPARFVCLNCDTVFDLSGRTYQLPR